MGNHSHSTDEHKDCLRCDEFYSGYTETESERREREQEEKTLKTFWFGLVFSVMLTVAFAAFLSTIITDKHQVSSSPVTPAQFHQQVPFEMPAGNTYNNVPEQAPAPAQTQAEEVPIWRRCRGQIRPEPPGIWVTYDASCRVISRTDALGRPIAQTRAPVPDPPAEFVRRGLDAISPERPGEWITNPPAASRTLPQTREQRPSLPEKRPTVRVPQAFDAERPGDI